jgi:hypothetical protein
MRQCLAHLRSPTTHQLPELFHPTKPVEPTKPQTTLLKFRKNVALGVLGVFLVLGLLGVYLIKLSPKRIEEPAGFKSASEQPNNLPSLERHLNWDDGLENDLQNLKMRLQGLKN